MKLLMRWLLLAAVTSTCTAEVRVERRPQGPTLHVRAASQGVWTPLRSSAHRDVLNPRGDLLGDGFPASLSSGRQLFVAWHRAVDATIHLAEFGDAGLNRETVIAAASVAGVPVLAPITDGVIVHWTAVVSGYPVVMAATIVAGAVVDEGVVADGYLLDVIATDSSLVLVAWDPSTLHVIVGRVALGTIYPQPIPIPTTRISVQVLRSTYAVEGVDPEPNECSTLADEEVIVAVETSPGSFEVFRDVDGRLHSSHSETRVGSCSVALAHATR